ncbi:MAG TPA: YceI family protein [Flavobacteriaceae bacterium]|nr:YceI family protein [Flavobacteriaceae bacterium]
MKKQILNLFLVTAVALGAVSCKNNQESAEEALVLEEVNEEVTSKDFVIDAQNSTIKWEGYKPGTTHDGLVALQEGKFILKDKQIVEGNFVIDMASIEVLDLEGEYKERLENHLTGHLEGTEGQFFDVGEFPTANFKVKGTSLVDGTPFLVGDLTLKEKTNEVSFPFEVEMVDNQVVSIKTAPFIIDRSKWDIKFKSKSFFENLGDNFISDDIQLEIELVAKVQ